MQENYLAKWLNGELTEAELKVFKESEEYATYKKIRDTSEKLQAPDFNMEKAWESIENHRVQKAPKVITLAPFKTFLKIAAVIAVLIAGSYFYLSTLGVTVITELAENKEIILPDNSEIILNAESELSYNEKNWDKKRNITLDGEAFFKVAKGKKFTVTTEQGSVTVLGTQFNVENREGFFEVSCFEGLVSVTMNGQETKLSAGYSLIAINGAVTKSEVTKNGQPSWLNNESSFKSIPLKYVLAEFQRQHNITVDASQIDDNQLFTGTFSNTDTDLALKSISTPLHIKYELKGNKVLFYEENAP
ncbi:FecR family protein [Maribacter sp. MMG018]|uniref:FecR family protein n=1 Tax=Maribacter sp. MMG018 TaxID=2822688 RepID=UPI001B368C7D|nr:FecR domain-containing protein [Maribacter sp. MMG018]MBQ4914147.1 FecR family protein [Maribacter sp. MMG018]